MSSTDAVLFGDLSDGGLLIPGVEEGTSHIVPFWRTVSLRGCLREAGGLGVKPPFQTKSTSQAG
ncbi:MAG: hypothetical protein ACI8RZ_001167 [Myxococcota bacterium]|jgi:hypothetical protein